MRIVIVLTVPFLCCQWLAVYASSELRSSCRGPCGKPRERGSVNAQGLLAVAGSRLSPCTLCIYASIDVSCFWRMMALVKRRWKGRRP